MPSRRSLLKILVTLAAFAALLVPAVIVFGAGWIRIHAPEDVSRRELTPIEAWVGLAVFYVFWVVVVMIGLVFLLDRIGVKYSPVELPERESRRRRRRRITGMKYLRAREKASRPTVTRPPKRPAPKKPAPPADGRGNGRRPPDDGPGGRASAADGKANGDRQPPPGERGAA